MNIENIAMILGDISIGSVKFGPHALSRFNQDLPESLHLSETLRGTEIERIIADLPEDILEKVTKKRLLNTSETSSFMADITKIRNDQTYINRISDCGVATFVAIIAVATLFIGFLSVMYYVFVAEGDDQPLSGIMFDTFIAIKNYVVAYLNKAAGIKP